MKCPFCGHEEDKVVDSRSTREGAAIRRRRECISCSQRFTTYEYVEDAPLMVVKRDGRSESFDRAKLQRGVSTSLAKRPISAPEINRLVSEVDEQCHGLGRHEIKALEIGEMVMSRLRELDKVAYIRFASVYRRFEDAGEFRKELDRM